MLIYRLVFFIFFDLTNSFNTYLIPFQKNSDLRCSDYQGRETILNGSNYKNLTNTLKRYNILNALILVKYENIEQMALSGNGYLRFPNDLSPKPKYIFCDLPYRTGVLEVFNY